MNQVNQVILSAVVLTKATAVKTERGTIHKVLVESSRASGAKDLVEVVYKQPLMVGKTYRFQGALKAVWLAGRSKRFVYVEAESAEECEAMEVHENCVRYTGTLLYNVRERKTTSGKAVASLSLGQPRTKGEYLPFISAVCWYQNVEKSKHFAQYAKVYVEGRLESRVFHPSAEEEEAFEVLEIAVSTIDKVLYGSKEQQKRKEMLLALINHDRVGVMEQLGNISIDIMESMIVTDLRHFQLEYLDRLGLLTPLRTIVSNCEIADDVIENLAWHAGVLEEDNCVGHGEIGSAVEILHKWLLVRSWNEVKEIVETNKEFVDGITRELLEPIATSVFSGCTKITNGCTLDEFERLSSLT